MDNFWHITYDDKWFFQTQCGSALVDRPDKSFVPRRTALAGQSIGQKDFDIHSVPSSNVSPWRDMFLLVSQKTGVYEVLKRIDARLMGYGQYSTNQKIRLKQSGRISAFNQS
jgi:hypothetical protein